MRIDPIKHPTRTAFGALSALLLTAACSESATSPIDPPDGVDLCFHAIEVREGDA